MARATVSRFTYVIFGHLSHMGPFKHSVGFWVKPWLHFFNEAESATCKFQNLFDSHTNCPFLSGKDDAAGSLLLK